MRCFVVTPSRTQPRIINFPSPLKKIDSCDDYTLFLTADGTIYIAYGEQVPVKLVVETKLKKCYSCKKKAIAACNICNVFICRACDGSKEHAFHGTVVLEGKPKIIDISCGVSHSFIIYSNGDLLAFGKNICGQLCIGHRFFVHVPEHVENIQDCSVKMVRCGRNHTVLVGSDKENFDLGDQVFACGSGTLGQLGSSSYEKLEYSKENLSELSTIHFSRSKRKLEETEEELEGEDSNNTSLTKMNTTNMETLREKLTYFMETKNNTTTRVISQTKFGETRPVLVNSPIFQKKKIKSVACGENYNLFLTTSNELIGFGDNRKGQLGLDSSESSGIVNQPLLLNGNGELNNEQILRIGCGGSHTIVGTESGFYCCGANESGQLFGKTFKDEENEDDPSTENFKKEEDCVKKFVKMEGFDLERVVAVDCGRFFSVVVTVRTMVVRKRVSDINNIDVMKFNQEARLNVTNYVKKKNKKKATKTGMQTMRDVRNHVAPITTSKIIREKKKIYKIRFYGGPFLRCEEHAVETSKEIFQVSCQKKLFYFLSE